MCVYRWKLKTIMRSSYLSLSILYLQAYFTKVKKKKKIYKNVRYSTHINMTQRLIGKKHTRLCNYTSVFDLQCNIHFRCFSTIVIYDFIYKLDRFEISRRVVCALIKLLLVFFLLKPLYILIGDRFLLVIY